MYYVYILNCDNAFFYVGLTNNLDRRVMEHQRGEEKYTKRFCNIQFVYKEEYESREIAEKRERQLKGWTKEKKKALIGGDIELLKHLSKSKS